MELFSKKKITEGDKIEELICRFVYDSNGRKIGESIALEEDILIIKQGRDFLGIPLKHIEIQEKNLLVKGLFDKDKALELGENWRRENERREKPSVSIQDGDSNKERP